MAGDCPEGNWADTYGLGGGTGQSDCVGVLCAEGQGGAVGAGFEERDSGARGYPAANLESTN